MKERLGHDASARDIVQRVAEDWRNLSIKEKQIWLDKSVEDKKRYEHSYRPYGSMTRVSNSANILPKIQIAILLNYFVCDSMNYKTATFLCSEL